MLVVDGSFLPRPEKDGAWELVVYLHASFESAEERGVARDAAALGGVDAARAAFRTRYRAAQRRYLAECSPASTTDVVIDAEDVGALRVIGLGAGPHSSRRTCCRRRSGG